MADDRSEDRRLWQSLATALGAELREGTSIGGASGLTHDLRALCVDEKGGRLILFSDEPNPRVAALIQGDVQATIDSAKVIVARPSIVDLGAVVRGFFDSPAAAMISMDDIAKHSERFNALGEAEKRDIFTATNWRALDSMMGALKWTAPGPLDKADLSLDCARSVRQSRPIL